MLRGQQIVTDGVVGKVFNGGVSSVGLAVAGPMYELSQGKIEELSHDWVNKQEDKKHISKMEKLLL